MHPDASTLLKESIAKLEAQQEEEKNLLKEELSYAFEHLKPANMIKDTMGELISTVHARSNIVTTLLGNGAGYLVSAIFGPKPTLLNKLGARFLQQAVSMAITQNSQVITDMALNLVTSLRKKIEAQKEPLQSTEDLLRDGAEAI